MKDLVLLDVDHTLIQPRHGGAKEGMANCFTLFLRRFPGRFSQFLLGLIRKYRGAVLMDQSWPDVIKTLQDKGACVIALTAMDTGACGILPSIEDWRADQLKALGFCFSTPLTRKTILLRSEKGYACYDRGILFTGPFKKGETLDAFLTLCSLIPQEIVFVDDNQRYLDDVKQTCDNRGIAFTGILF